MQKTIIIPLVAAVCLIGVCVAEPQLGDAVMDVRKLVSLGVCGLFVLTVLWCLWSSLPMLRYLICGRAKR